MLLLAACSMLDFSAADATATDTVVFEVPAGSTARSIGPALVQAGLVRDETAWKVWLKLEHAGGCLKAGRFALSPAMDFDALMAAMCGVPLPEEVPFTVVEGWRIRDIDAALAEKGFIQAGEYAAAAAAPARFRLPDGFDGLKTLEGLLYPETYMVPETGFAVDPFIQRQVDTFARHFPEIGSRTPYDVLVVASMVEREERVAARRPLVAGIIWKRLDQGWNLGIDATSHYELPDWNDRPGLLANLRDPNDPYNTRLRPGLPPTPIGNPDRVSLEAAAHPVASEFWYYLHDAQGGLHPSRTAREHEALRARYNVY